MATTTPLNERHLAMIAGELRVRSAQVTAAAELLGGGATVPFIARYRKEATGSLDEVAIAAVRDRLAALGDLDARRDTIVASLETRGLMTDDLRARVAAADSLTLLEDIYLPYRPKRRTRATIAKEQGLEPLARKLFAQETGLDPAAEAEAFRAPDKGVELAEEALAGARDIIAEWASEDTDARAEVRELFLKRGAFKSQVVSGKEIEGAKFKDYFDWTESLATAPSHRVLAMRRGEREGFLYLRVEAPDEDAVAALDRRFVRGPSPSGEQVRLAVKDGYERLLRPSMETEVRLASKKRADEDAIKIFATNLRQLLLAAPLGQKNVLAIDPGFRTGCKVVCLDRQGKLLHHDVVNPHAGGERAAEAAGRMVEALCQRFEIEAIAIGNGTAGRETEAFVRGLKLARKPPVVMVNESGASIYSASDVAREEFPDHDVTVRGSVSIGRRLMDPLAELVKLDPKSIGVGQYQHDVDQGDLKKTLDDGVTSCVNHVGVEVNTASKELLSYVSGLNTRIAASIVAHRNEKGPFPTRAALKEVKGLGPKTFEQAAGFLRIRGSPNPLDASAVHPESYGVVEAMARDLGATVTDLMRDDTLRKRVQLKTYVTDKIGLPTLQDIAAELSKPGRDPRDRFDPVQFAEGVNKLEDLQPGMRLDGIVTNITAFGAFVDVGVHQDGLVHISQLADRRVNDPAEVVKVHQKVSVTVLDVDLDRKRIALSMRKDAAVPRGPGSNPGAAAGKGGGPQARPEARPERRSDGRSGGDSRMADLLKDWQKNKKS